MLTKGNAIFYVEDTFDFLLGKKDPTIPPTRLMFDGPQDAELFKQNGEEFLRYFITIGHLKPNEVVLDVGSGIGRKAIPLTKYLDSTGRYEGFDITKKGVRWCEKNISSKYPNFHFQFVDVFNRSYNPKGKHHPSRFKFPFENECFDFLFLGSVFTHMMPNDMKNYFSEIARVLKKGGRCLITFFILNNEVLKLIEAKKSSIIFEYKSGKYLLADCNSPEAAVCYDESFIIDLFANNNLNVNKPLHYGSWPGRIDFLSYQDIIVATKI